MALHQVFVTNHNPEAYSDRYDGQDYVFPPGQAVPIPQDAATHIFGYGLDDKTDTLARLGKTFKVLPTKEVVSTEMEGVRWLANFTFEEAVMTPRSALSQALAANSGELEIA